MVGTRFYTSWDSADSRLYGLLETDCESNPSHLLVIYQILREYQVKSARGTEDSGLQSFASK
jgi:hypothetical protein